VHRRAKTQSRGILIVMQIRYAKVCHVSELPPPRKRGRVRKCRVIAFPKRRNVEAEEAFYYADVVKDPRDTPNFSENSEAGGDIALGQEYEIWAWWDEILREVLESYYLKLPPHEYYAKLRTIQPELSKLAVSLDKRSAELRKEVTSKVEHLVVPAFGKAAAVAKIA
jgi:hypothetical protein